MKNIARLCISFVLLIAASAVAQQAAQPAGDGQPAQEVSLEEVQQASLILGDVAEQMRIAQAKLDKTALERKKQIGRLQAYEAAAEEQVQDLAVQTERLLERHQQISEQLANLAQIRKSRGIDDARLKALISESQNAVDASKARLEKVSRQRSQIQQKLDELKAEHITSLLEAGVKLPSSQADGPSAIERLLDTELQPTSK